MRKIPHVLNGESINHKGDLTVEGDVGENAVIEIEDGSLIVDGSVGSRSQISVRVSEELRKKSVISGLGNVVVSGGGCVVVSSGVGASMSFGGLSRTRISGFGGTVTSVSANQSMNINGVQIYMGNVNINNRILTDGTVKECGDDIYEIVATSKDMIAFFLRSSPKASSGPVLATIDGVDYRGLLIRVEGKNVIVDGQRSAGSGVPAAAAAEVPQDTQLTPSRLCIKGAIREGVRIISDVAMDIQEIGRGCVLQSTHEGITAGNVGDNTQINVRGTIKVKHVGLGVRLDSSFYGIGAKNIGNGSTIVVRDAIDVENIGDLCTVTSQQYGIRAGNVGVRTTIAVRDAVILNNIGSDSNVSSQMYGLHAKILSDRVKIQARDGVGLQSVGKECSISSQQSAIEVEGHVNTSSRLEAREDIIVSSLGDNTSLSTTQGRIKASGNTGDNVVLKARESVHLKDVGRNAQITSTQNEVSLRNIGINATITAREDIDIDGTCPDPQSLTLSNRKGKRIQRPTKGPAVVQAFNTPQADALAAQGEITYITGSYGGDLKRALELSQTGAKASSVGFFAAAPAAAAAAPAAAAAAPAAIAVKPKITIPKSFECNVSN